jgi:hypothetical protein
MAITIAKPTVASAAATAMIKRAKAAPCPASDGMNAPSARAARFTAFSINSMLISMLIALRRARNPNAPMAKSIPDRTRYGSRCPAI